jgi:cytochrome P450
MRSDCYRTLAVCLCAGAALGLGADSAAAAGFGAPSPGVIALVVVLLLLYKISAKGTGGAPSPPGYPFLGNTLEFLANFDTLPDLVLKYTLQYKGTFGMRMLGLGPMKNGVVIISSPENVKYVMKDAFDNFEKGPLFKAPLHDFLGNGIFTSDGVQWRTHRKVAAAMFTRNLLQLGTTVALAQAQKLRAKIEEHVASGAEFNLQACYFNFTLDVFASIAFGVELDSQNHAHAFGTAFDFVQRVSNDRFGNPLWEAKRALGLGNERECARQIKIMKAFGRRIIKSKRREASDAPDNMGPDLISRFLQAARRNGDPEPSDDELLDVVLNFMIAGRDTTAAALSWTTVELLRAPRVLKAVHAELASVLPQPPQGQGGGGGEPTAAESESMFSAVYNRLPYLKAVCSEALRLHPSVMKEAKFAIKADTLPDGTRVRAGQGVFFSPWVMGRLPNLFESPNEFKPERFTPKQQQGGAGAGGDGGGDGGDGNSGTSLYASVVSDYTQPVFNAGPRVCLGRPLAYLEIQLLLAFLLQRFDFKLARPTNDEYTSSLVSPLKHGLWVKAAARK